MAYYHICSDGNHSFALFLSDRDFKAAMNAVAICALITKIDILAFVLMDNHFHFAVRAESEEQCRRFVILLKQLIGLQIAKTSERRGVLSRLPVKIIPVTGDDYLKTLICYIIKNPTKARKEMFYSYPWGSGTLYFNGRKQKADGARAVREHTRREITRTVGTHSKLPPDWMIVDGMILQENYVRADEVEALFKTTRSFMYYLSMKTDEPIEKDYQEWNDIGLDDTEIRRERDVMAKKLFNVSRLRDLAVPERIIIAKHLRRKFLCPHKQLSRVMQVPLKDIEKIFV